MTEIKPCPFPSCGSGSVALGFDLDGYYVECDECGARGPYSRDKIEAVELWNQAIRPARPERTAETILRCVFGSSTNGSSVEIRSTLNKASKTVWYWVECVECGAVGMSGQSEVEAIGLWNDLVREAIKGNE